MQENGYRVQEKTFETGEFCYGQAVPCRQESYIVQGNTESEIFRSYLLERECAPATIVKYETDIKTFFNYMEETKIITKKSLLEYKSWLMEHYAPASVNSMLVALNQFLVSLGMERWKIKRVKIQRQNVREDEKELNVQEYLCLVKTARELGKDRLAMILETICATGIRVSELQAFRTDNVKKGVVKVWNKGKYRIVVLPEKLRKKLLVYMAKHKIQEGRIFITSGGKPMNRSNIWADMKKLSLASGIQKEKLFPHNLRHLFARSFYKNTGNLMRLADILGHSNLETTRIYTSEGIEEWRNEIEKVGLIDYT